MRPPYLLVVCCALSAMAADIQLTFDDQPDGVLRLTGREQQSHELPLDPRRDFDLRFQVRGAGGIHFRDGYKVFFKRNGTMWIRRPGAMLLRWVREPRDLTRAHTIRVVAAGPIVRVYVDDVLELECLDQPPAAGPFAFCGSGNFDNLTISAQIPPTEATLAVPRDAGANFHEENSYERLQPEGPRVEDIALVFRSTEPVRVPLRLVNLAKLPLRLTATLAGKTRDASTDTTLDFGTLPPGFHFLELTLANDGRLIRTTQYPVFVGEPPDTSYTAPDIAFGVCLANVVWKPIHTRTYWHAIASLMQGHHMNTVVATGGCHRQLPETFQRYGISTLVRSENRLEHPAVIGLFNSAPRHMIDLQAQLAKPVLTYLRLEKVGTGGADDPLAVWADARPAIRLLRFPSAWDATHGLAQLDAVRAAADTPWWALLQANEPAVTLRLQTHLALAHGAKGILVYCLQQGADFPALVHPITLQPVDDRLDVLAEAGNFTETHAATLRLFNPGRILSCTPPSVIAMHDSTHLYAVNTDVVAVAHATTIFPDNRTRTLRLAPGDGRLIEWKQAPR